MVTGWVPAGRLVWKGAGRDPKGGLEREPSLHYSLPFALDVCTAGPLCPGPFSNASPAFIHSVPCLPCLLSGSTHPYSHLSHFSTCHSDSPPPPAGQPRFPTILTRTKVPERKQRRPREGAVAAWGLRFWAWRLPWANTRGLNPVARAAPRGPTSYHCPSLDSHTDVCSHPEGYLEWGGCGERRKGKRRTCVAASVPGRGPGGASGVQGPKGGRWPT